MAIGAPARSDPPAGAKQPHGSKAVSNLATRLTVNIGFCLHCSAKIENAFGLREQCALQAEMETILNNAKRRHSAVARKKSDICPTRWACSKQILGLVSWQGEQ